MHTDLSKGQRSLAGCHLTLLQLSDRLRLSAVPSPIFGSTSNIEHRTFNIQRSRETLGVAELNVGSWKFHVERSQSAFIRVMRAAGTACQACYDDFEYWDKLPAAFEPPRVPAGKP